MKNFDLDIDTPTNTDPSKIFKGSVKASRIEDELLRPHPCGFYFQDIKTDVLTSLSAIPYKEAEKLDYFKVDFLHLSIYDHFSSKEEINELLKIEPDWNLLLIPSTVKSLFQLGNHYDILSQVKPKTVLELADVLALIRPSKRFLLKYYLENPIKFRTELYKQSENDAYSFKKAHAVSYALVVCLQLHLIKAGIKF